MLLQSTRPMGIISTGANLARRQFEMAFHLLSPPTRYWTPPVLTCSALTMDGIAQIFDGDPKP